MSKNIVIIIIYSFLIVSCQSNSLIFPNDYSLENGINDEMYLKNPKNQKIINSPISQFCVRDNCVYGWVDDKNETFFFLDTNTGALNSFETWEQIDQFLDKKGWPRLKMKDSFTYLDIKTGHKKKTW